MSEVTFKTAIFEGPLDLLLHLISKNKVNIYDIPIANITDQYFEYISLMEALDMEISSSFLVMAAQLLLIKSKMLLPTYDEEEEDPRLELVDQLEEYRRYKLVAESMDKQQHVMDNVVFKGREELNFPKVKIENKNMPVGVLFDAFCIVLERNTLKKTINPKEFQNIVGKSKVSLESRRKHVLDIIKKQKRIVFEDIFSGMNTRAEIVVTFLAVLELIKNEEIMIEEKNGKIICEKREEKSNGHTKNNVSN